jgi:Tol biopolymer transport system component
MAQRFDADRLQLEGEAHLLGVRQQRSWFETDSNYSIFSVSHGGTLVSGSRQYYKSHLTWFDRSGKPIGTVGEPDIYGEPSLAPDERKISVQRFDQAAGKWSVWLVNLDHGTFSRFTFSSGNPAEGLWQSASLWSPDGKWIVFSASPTGSSYDLYQKLSNGVSNPEILLHSESAWTDDWSADGRYLLYENVDPKTSVDSWILPLFGERKPLPFLHTTATEMMARFSPDVRWIAYVSDETGRAEVFVRPFPSLGGGKWQISTGGGQQPAWSRDGKELFYVADDRKLMSVNVQMGETFQASTPSPLFQTNLIPNTFGSYFYWERNQYLATADGKRFLLESAVNEQISSPITVILNWPTLVKN